MPRHRRNVPDSLLAAAKIRQPKAARLLLASAIEHRLELRRRGEKGIAALYRREMQRRRQRVLEAARRVDRRLRLGPTEELNGDRERDQRRHGAALQFRPARADRPQMKEAGEAEDAPHRKLDETHQPPSEGKAGEIGDLV